LSSEEPILIVKTRKTIYLHIKNNPGLHKRELSRILKIPYSTLTYHLRYLTKQGLVSKKKNNGYSRYYVKDYLGSKEKKVLDCFRQKVTKNILLFLMYHFVSTEKELSKHIEKHPTTIKHHLKKLLDLDIIEYAPVENGEIDNKLPFKGPAIMRRPIKNEKMYRVKDRILVEGIMTILIDTLLKDKDFRAFYDTCEDIKSSHGIPKKQKTFDKAVDDALDGFLKIFPIPWCA